MRSSCLFGKLWDVALAVLRTAWACFSGCVHGPMRIIRSVRSLVDVQSSAAVCTFPFGIELYETVGVTEAHIILL